MKVLLVSSSSGSMGGGEIYLHHLSFGLSRLGHRVQALCSAAPVMDKIADTLGPFAEVYRIEMANTYRRRTRCLGAALDFEEHRRFSRKFRELAPDVVHINQQVAEDGLDLMLAARDSGVPVLSTIHITRSAEGLGARLGKLRDLVTTKVLRRVNMVHITVAECGKKDLLGRFDFLGPQQVRVVPNGTFFTDADSTIRDRTRTRWGVGSGDVVIGSVGRLDAQKEPIFALKIISKLRQKDLPIRYVWIGDGRMRSTFQEEAGRLGIANSVTLDGWRDDVSDCLRGLDIFILPSKFEGMPLALLEAMGAGLCCCASDVDGIAETIENGLNGYLCPPGDLQGWCRQLDALVTDPESRMAVGTRAHALARRRFSVEAMATETAKVYQDVVCFQQKE
jgi:glycosyltransferase involved in cell wall biosynthesis